ncbi:MAG: amino acid racemase [bacterium]|nr:MAG: amino acid racemase [bacterium]
MKRIGMIGGLGPEATLEYYRIITETFHERQSGSAYPEMVIYSMDVRKALRMAEAGQWSELAEWLSGGVSVLEKAGAAFAFISANTPHIVFDEVREAARIPLISIVEETCRAARELKLAKVGLLGTRFTMQATFYQNVFSRDGIEVVVPSTEEQDYIHTKLIDEIGLGHIVDSTRQRLLEIIRRMIDEQGIEGVVLGCTELPLIITEEAGEVPFLNTTRIHAESAVRYSLSQA